MSKKVLTVLTVVASVLLLASIFANLFSVYVGVSSDTFIPFDYVVAIALSIASILAVYYALTGCRKGEGSVYFRWFMFSLALVQLIALFQHASMSILTVLMLTISFGCLLVLFIAKDLGQKLSTLLAGIVSAAAVAQFIIAAATGTLAVAWVKIATLTLLALTALLMVFAKYADKKARGSK